MIVSMPAPVLCLIDTDESPHETTDQNDRFGFPHMDLFFKYDQSIGKAETDQRQITDPGGSETMHSSILSKKVESWPERNS
jgi:hypothetical protein